MLALGRRVGRCWRSSRPAAATTTAATTTDGDDGASTTTERPTRLPEGEPIKFVVADRGRGRRRPAGDLRRRRRRGRRHQRRRRDPRSRPAARPARSRSCAARPAPAATSIPTSPCSCAQDTIDEGVIAVVGRYLFGADGTAGVGRGRHPDDRERRRSRSRTSPTSSCTRSAAARSPAVPASGIALQEAGAETIALITGDVEAGRQLPGPHDARRSTTEDDLVQEVYVPLDPSADYTPQLSQLVSANPDAIAVFGSSDINVRVIAGLRSAGYTGLIGVPGTGLTPEGLETLGDAAEGLLVVSGLRGRRPATARRSSSSTRRWTPTRPTRPAPTWPSTRGRRCTSSPTSSRELDTIDSASLVAALDGREVDLGVAPPFTMGVPDNQLDLPRIFRVTFQVQEVERRRDRAVGRRRVPRRERLRVGLRP